MGTSRRDNTHPGRETVRAHYDWEATTPSQAIVEAVATVEETTPVALAREAGTTVYEHIDPDALDSLVGSDRTGVVEVAFDIDHHHITIASDGRLVITVGDQ
ncbi:HalOD1 output domain-containing protein [Natrinema salaciae]|uniref:Halobacterial output domain-containing protein n=1 Tax=Natrinema salaciae TaxID=1186196 RepID=A0A1H9BPA0_9EURY|nr:HalOD1 output domain-containing protein [Natrinema salaciae]SEP90363.1 hypothetical protein SAMN04489841_0802 [Natrinema salaciae]